MIFELVGTLASVGTLVVIGATAIVAVIQSRHARASKQIVGSRRAPQFVLGAILIIALAGSSKVSTATSTSTTTSNDADSQRFMNTVIPAIFGTWDVAALAASSDRRVYTTEQLNKDRVLFKGFVSTLGPMTAYHQAHGTTQILKTPGGETKHASYTARLSYAKTKGPATIRVDATEDHGVWKIESASVQPYYGAGSPTMTIYALNPTTATVVDVVRVAQAESGAQIFAANCESCHGAAGAGGDSPPLRNERQRKNLAQMIGWIENPAPPMPKLYPSPLSKSEVETLAKYVESL